MTTEDDRPAMRGPRASWWWGRRERATGADKSIRRELPVLFAEPAHAHLRIVRLSRLRDAEARLAGLAPE